MTELKTRQPTGRVAHPMLLIEGLHKKGKSKTALDLSNSDLVGRTFVFELGERTADEYAPLGDFEIVEHNGTFGGLLQMIQAATAEPRIDDKPNVIIIDSGTALWELLKNKADALARRTKRARDLLAQDPDADVETTMTQWTAVKSDYWQIINHLRAWDGITVITARSDIVTKVVNGRPVPGQTERSIQIEKGTPFAVTGIVRVDYPNPPVLMGVQSLNVQIPDDNGLELPLDGTLEDLIFKRLGAGGRFDSGVVVNPALGVAAGEAMNIVLERALAIAGNEPDAKEIAAAAWDGQGLRGMPEITTEQLAAALKSMERPPEGSEEAAESTEAAQAAPDEPAEAEVVQPTLGVEQGLVGPEPEPETEPEPKAPAKAKTKPKAAPAPTLDEGEPAA